MKRFLLVILILFIFITNLCLSGCKKTEPPLVSSDGNLSQSYNNTSSQSENAYTIEEKIIEGLDAKNTDLIKSIFSKQSMELCDDIDEGIEYIFGIYDGTFENFVYRNTSATKYYDGGVVTTLAEPIYVFKTSSDKYYKLMLSIWKVEGADSDKEGVYSMYFFECDADSKGGGGGPYFAGIDYPERSGANAAIGSIVYSITRNDSKELKKAFSENVLNKNNNSEKIDAFFENWGRVNLSSVGPAWVRVGENKTCSYIVVNTKPKRFIYISLEDGQSDKISTMKITKIEEGKTLNDYVLETDEAGFFYHK